MINIHCSQLKEFLKIYVFDWHILPTLLVPVIFTLFFPIYWFVLCPLIWKEFPNTVRPRSMLIGKYCFYFRHHIVQLKLYRLKIHWRRVNIHLSISRLLALCFNGLVCFSCRMFISHEKWS